jgi:hypothetical protein
MLAAQMFRDDHLHGSSNCFKFRIAKQLLGILAPSEDPAESVDRECCALRKNPVF